nr:MAG TPA: hypothetical protein [Caudoviricetes sp.]
MCSLRQQGKQYSAITSTFVRKLDDFEFSWLVSI